MIVACLISQQMVIFNNQDYSKKVAFVTCQSSNCNLAQELNHNCCKWLAVVCSVVIFPNYKLDYWMNTNSSGLFFDSHGHPANFLVWIDIWSKDANLGGFD